MSLAFAQYLEDFGSSSDLPQLTMIPEIPKIEEAPPAQAPIDIEAEKAAAYQAGYSAASQALANDHAAQMENLVQAHKDELADKEAEIYTQISQDLMGGLASQIDRATSEIKSEVSAILMQIIEEDLAQRSIEKLDEIIKKTLKDNPGSKIEISGPDKLLTKIKLSLGEEFDHINLTEAQNTDLSVEIDQSILKTRLFEWQKNLEINCHE